MVSVEIPKMSIAFGQYGIPQGDVIECRVHLGCTKEVSSFDLLLQNWDGKYSPDGSIPLAVGLDGSISIGRGSNVPQIITCRIENLKYVSTPTEHYVRVSGRCWGERLFRSVFTGVFENMKGEDIVRYLLDYYVGLSHNRDGTELVEATDTTYTKLEYENTPVFDIIKFIAETADKQGVIGFDFRVAPDGKFEFFPKNSKTSPISLSEVIEEIEYTRDISRVRNWIAIYGAAEKSVPDDKDSYSDGVKDYMLSSGSVETAHRSQNYQLVQSIIHVPEAQQKILLKSVEFKVKVNGGTGYYKITCQKEGEAETTLVSDQAFTNTSYETKQHACNVMGSLGKNVIVRFYTKINDSTYTVYSRDYKIVSDVFYGDWIPMESSQISVDVDTKVRGNASIKCWGSGYTVSCKLNFPSSVNCDLYPILSLWLKRQTCSYLQIRLFDGDGCWVDKVFSENAADWVNKQFKVGSKNADEWQVYSMGFNWTNVAAIQIFATQETGSLWVDGVYFGGRRYYRIQQDAASQQAYGIRQLVDVDEELHSDNECFYRANALLNYLKNPAEYLTIKSTVIDYGNTPLLPGDKIHVTLPNENVDADFRIETVEYRVDAKTQTLEITLELGRETPLLADYLYALKSKADQLSRYKIAR